MATINTNRKDFDFDAYNAVMKGANAGLKLFLVEQMLNDIGSTAARYRNPLYRELLDKADEVTSLRKQWKEIAAKSQRQTQTGEAAPQADAPVFDANDYKPAIF